MGPLLSEAEQEAEEKEHLLPLQLPLLPTNPPDPLPPVGACLQLYLPLWMALFPSSPWITSVVRFGFRICFETHPPLTRSPKWIQVPKNPLKAAALRAEVQKLLVKEATQLINQQSSPGYYSGTPLQRLPKNGQKPVFVEGGLYRGVRTETTSVHVHTIFHININKHSILNISHLSSHPLEAVNSPRSMFNDRTMACFWISLPVTGILRRLASQNHSQTDLFRSSFRLM